MYHSFSIYSERSRLVHFTFSYTHLKSISENFLKYFITFSISRMKSLAASGCVFLLIACGKSIINGFCFHQRMLNAERSPCTTPVFQKRRIFSSTIEKDSFACSAVSVISESLGARVTSSQRSSINIAFSKWSIGFGRVAPSDRSFSSIVNSRRIQFVWIRLFPKLFFFATAFLSEVFL